MSVASQTSDALRLVNANFGGESDFDHLRGRLFLNGGNQRTQAFVQLKYSDNSEVAIHGAYLVHRVLEAQAVYLEAGKIPLHDGIWAPNTYAQKNALVGIPLAYYYKSSLASGQVPVDLDQVLAMRGRGQVGVAYTETNGDPRGSGPGMPMLYDNCWNYGAYVLGSGSRFDYAVGATIGTPGAPVVGGDTNDNITWHVRLGVQPFLGLQVHASFARGAFMAASTRQWLPVGKTENDYYQTLWIGSLEWEWRYLTMRSEVMRNHLDTPVRDAGLGSIGWYVEGQYAFFAGWYVAARFDELQYDQVENSVGQSVSWDDRVRRAEFGGGYRITRELRAKVVGQWTRTALIGSEIQPAVQLTFSF
jgi:hypothetical protein